MIISWVLITNETKGIFNHVSFGNIHTKRANVIYLLSFNNFLCSMTVMVSLVYLTSCNDIFFQIYILSYN